MKWLDVTLPLGSEVPVWPGDAPFVHTVTGKIGQGGSQCNLSRVEMGVHFGTHIDAPFHYLNNTKTVDQLDLELLLGPCLVVEVTETESLIEPVHLERIPARTKRVFLKTVNSGRFLADSRFHREYAALSVSAARFLLAKGVRLIGIDYLSLERFDSDGEAHRIFLAGNDTAVVEGVDLAGVEPGAYQLICLPLKVKGAGGAPARVLLGRAGSELIFSGKDR